MKLKKALLAGGLLLLGFMGGLVFWLFPALALRVTGEEDNVLAASHAALENIGLSTWAEQAEEPSLSFNTHGGFHGKGETLVIFESDAALMASIAQTEDWRIAAIPDSDYAALAQRWFQEVPLVAPPAGTVFDAWFYRNDQGGESGGLEEAAYYAQYLPESLKDMAYTLRWTAAFYDADSGLMIYYRLDR